MSSRRPLLRPGGFKPALSGVGMIAGVETFVIRIWTPAERDDDPERYRLRGLVEHVGSGERDAFRGAGELLAFLDARLDPTPKELQARRRR